MFEKKPKPSNSMFTETKQLKSLVRNIIDPSRDLGHVDRALAKGSSSSGGGERQSGQKAEQEESQIQTTVVPTSGTDLPATQRRDDPGTKTAECEDCK
jgi:hypothetical protein